MLPLSPSRSTERPPNLLMSYPKGPPPPRSELAERIGPPPGVTLSLITNFQRIQSHTLMGNVVIWLQQ